jgi:hypothetical protein
MRPQATACHTRAPPASRTCPCTRRAYRPSKAPWPWTIIRLPAHGAGAPCTTHPQATARRAHSPGPASKPRLSTHPTCLLSAQAFLPVRATTRPHHDTTDRHHRAARLGTQAAAKGRHARLCANRQVCCAARLRLSAPDAGCPDAEPPPSCVTASPLESSISFLFSLCPCEPGACWSFNRWPHMSVNHTVGPK